MSEEKVRVGLRLTEEESETVERYAAACGLSRSEFMRRLCMGRLPQPKPEKEFWELLNTLYEVHAAFKECIPYDPVAAETCKEIETFIIDLQREMTSPQEVIPGSPQSLLCGEKEHPCNGELLPPAEKATNGV